MKSHLPPETIAWAKAKCEEVIRTCQIRAIDGTILFTPDGVGAYGALWTRDFAYLVEHGAEFLNRDDVRAAIDVLVTGQRKDGAVPDRVNRFLVPLYQPGETANPIGAGPALDNGMFLVSLVFHYHRHFGDDDYVAGLLPALRRGLDYVPRNRGLVFNDAQKPCSTYGFQDTIGKGGHDLFCSLLWVIACRQMSTLDHAASAAWSRAGAETEQALALLWDEDEGAYLAANERCRQIDIWGMPSSWRTRLATRNVANGPHCICKLTTTASCIADRCGIFPRRNTGSISCPAPRLAPIKTAAIGARRRAG